jgi:hypothetical protein
MNANQKRPTKTLQLFSKTVKNKPANKRKNGGREAVQFKLPFFLVKFPSRKFPGPANKLKTISRKTSSLKLQRVASQRNQRPNQKLSGQ